MVGVCGGEDLHLHDECEGEAGACTAEARENGHAYTPLLLHLLCGGEASGHLPGAGRPKELPGFVGRARGGGTWPSHGHARPFDRDLH